MQFKDDLTRIELGNFKKDRDFIVVSKMAYTFDHSFVPCNENCEEDEYQYITETIFDDEVVTHVYELDNHEINMDLAVSIGLGIIKDNYSGDLYLYNVEVERDSKTIDNELLKMGIYYQLTHPEYYDKQLDLLLNSTKGGEQYIRLLLLQPDDNDLISTLRNIFKSKKGGSNIVEFPKK